MRKIEVNAVTKNNEHFIATTVESIANEVAQSLKAEGRMLVDSDSLEFIYILENNDEFFYVSFPKTTWVQLNELNQSNKKIDLVLSKDVTIELIDICEELSYLIENIEGNGNYGEAMEKAVQEVFG